VIRHEYLVTREGFRLSGRALPETLQVREPLLADRFGIADLMMSAYLGTIDYDGETFEQAVEEVDGYFADEALLAESRIAERDGIIHSAVLVSLVEGEAFIGYVMTRADDKNRGLAGALLDLSVEAIWAAGYGHIRAFITEGNVPSEKIFPRTGFEVVGTIGN
jgi:RimJ/RimL family protein N-acetyltransferase